MNEASPLRNAVGETRSHPSLSEAVRTWVRVALLSFGGPAGQIAVMHRIIVEEKRWVSEERFLHALNYCMLEQPHPVLRMAIEACWAVSPGVQHQQKCLTEPGWAEQLSHFREERIIVSVTIR